MRPSQRCLDLLDGQARRAEDLTGKFPSTVSSRYAGSRQPIAFVGAAAMCQPFGSLYKR